MWERERERERKRVRERERKREREREREIEWCVYTVSMVGVRERQLGVERER